MVLIPAFKPDRKLLTVVEELSSQPEIAGVIVVDDGSGPGFRELFQQVSALPNVQLLIHSVNLGKGAALKTGLNFAAVSYPESLGVVTADADGQHTTEDILRVAAALRATPRHLVLGARRFDTDVPFRSRFGNTLTRAIMRAVTGQKLTDTQTGLRGIPLDFIPKVLVLRPTGYDLELEMLVACRNTGRPIREIPIQTIYLEGNRSSHFNPMRDSMRIYFVFVRFAGVSLATAAIDNGIFLAGIHMFPSVLACQALSRVVAGTFQFTAVRRNVFHSDANIGPAMIKFWTLVAFSGGLSYLIIQAMVRYTPIGVVPAKLAAETILFLLSFVVQRDFVFGRKLEPADHD
jgi:glycosyltransferase involved in cell wall biosynthesis